MPRITEEKCKNVHLTAMHVQFRKASNEFNPIGKRDLEWLLIARTSPNALYAAPGEPFSCSKPTCIGISHIATSPDKKRTWRAPNVSNPNMVVTCFRFVRSTRFIVTCVTGYPNGAGE